MTLPLQLNPQQAEAADRFLDWWYHERRKRDFHLRGLAGTGKTFLLQVLESKIRAKVAYCAPTGKAARVVSHRTGKEATTVHKMMYRPSSEEADRIRERLEVLHQGMVKKPEGDFMTIEEIEAEELELRRKLVELKRNGGSVKFSFRPPEPDFADVIILDEGSMVGSLMGRDLAEVEIPKVIVCDPFQLPPVKDTWAYKDIEADVFLTQIMRQGDGSGVARAAGLVREGKKLRQFGEEFVMAERGEINFGRYLDFDMILVGRNELRKKINKGFREVLGRRDQLLVVGEKLLALNNQDNGISNGETLIVDAIHSEMRNKFILDLVDGYGNFFPMVEAWKSTLIKDEGQPDCPKSIGQFCYGYAVTVHKAQGSEAKRVLLLNSWDMNRSDYRRWLYTGISRASEHCTFVK